MKKLSFHTIDLYELVYTAFAISANAYKGAQKVRIVAKVFDKLEAVGIHSGRKLGEFDLFTLPPFEADTVLYPTIELEDREFELLKEAVELTEWTSALGARKAVIIYDWLDSIK